MKQRHLDLLLARLERVKDIGSVEIRHAELRDWYDQKRVTVGIWRDIDERWRNDLGQTLPLFVGEAEGCWTFIWAEGLTTNNTWFKNVRHLARVKAEAEGEGKEELGS